MPNRRLIALWSVPAVFLCFGVASFFYFSSRPLIIAVEKRSFEEQQQDVVVSPATRSQQPLPVDLRLPAYAELNQHLSLLAESFCNGDLKSGLESYRWFNRGLRHPITIQDELNWTEQTEGLQGCNIDFGQASAFRFSQFPVSESRFPDEVRLRRGAGNFVSSRVFPSLASTTDPLAAPPIIDEVIGLFLPGKYNYSPKYRAMHKQADDYNAEISKQIANKKGLPLPTQPTTTGVIQEKIDSLFYLEVYRLNGKSEWHISATGFYGGAIRSFADAPMPLSELPTTRP